MPYLLVLSQYIFIVLSQYIFNANSIRSRSPPTFTDLNTCPEPANMSSEPANISKLSNDFLQANQSLLRASGHIPSPQIQPGYTSPETGHITTERFVMGFGIRSLSVFLPPSRLDPTHPHLPTAHSSWRRSPRYWDVDPHIVSLCSSTSYSSFPAP